MNNDGRENAGIDQKAMVWRHLNFNSALTLGEMLAIPVIIGGAWIYKNIVENRLPQGVSEALDQIEANSEINVPKLKILREAESIIEFAKKEIGKGEFNRKRTKKAILIILKKCRGEKTEEAVTVNAVC